MKTRNHQKFLKDRFPGRPMMLLVAVAIALTGLAACGGASQDRSGQGDGGTAQTNPATDLPPIESGDKVPKGLDDATDRALVAILQTDPNYSDYVALLQLSDVSRDLAIGDSLTVFAPVNEAVRSQSRLLNGYLAPNNLRSVTADFDRGIRPEIDDPEGLAGLLRRGIANGELPPEAVKAGVKLDPLAGDTLRITKSGDDFRVDGIRFDTGAGTLASNGILYPAAGLIAP
jgi:uncharacterized surface protein with fasciclin (FAS1) repeats